MNGERTNLPEPGEVSTFDATYAAILIFLREMLRKDCQETRVKILETVVTNTCVDGITIVLDVAWVPAIVRDLVDRKLLTVLRSQHRSGVVGLSATSLDEVGLKNARFRINPAVLHAKVNRHAGQCVNYNYGEQFFGRSSKFVDICSAPTSVSPANTEKCAECSEKSQSKVTPGPESRHESGKHRKEKPWHDSGTSPPEEFAYGPLTGKKGELARWILRKDDRRCLNTPLRNGSFRGREDAGTCSIWFKDQKRFADANKCKLADERGETI